MHKHIWVFLFSNQSVLLFVSPTNILYFNRVAVQMHPEAESEELVRAHDSLEDMSTFSYLVSWSLGCTCPSWSCYNTWPPWVNWIPAGEPDVQLLGSCLQDSGDKGSFVQPFLCPQNLVWTKKSTIFTKKIVAYCELH